MSNERITLNGKFVGKWTFRDDTVPMRFLKKSYERAREAAEQAIEYRKTLAADARLTDVGRKEKAADWAKGDIAKQASDAVRAIRNAKAELKRHMDSAKPLTIDKTDAAAAMIRAEFRRELKSMNSNDRSSLLTKAIARPEDYPELVAAIVEAPVELSGVTPSSRNMLLEKSIEANNPGLRETVEEISKAIETAERALRVAAEEIAETAGTMPSDAMKIIESAAAEPREREVAATLPDGTEIYYASPEDNARKAESAAAPSSSFADLLSQADKLFHSRGAA